jgi:hypothetical protein
MRSSRRASRIWRMAATDARVEKASRIRYEAAIAAGRGAQAHVGDRVARTDGVREGFWRRCLLHDAPS